MILVDGEECVMYRTTLFCKACSVLKAVVFADPQLAIPYLGMFQLDCGRVTLEHFEKLYF